LLEKVFDYDPVDEMVQICKIYGKKISREEAEKVVVMPFFVGTKEGLYKVVITKKKIVTKDGIRWKLSLEKEDPF